MVLPVVSRWQRCTRICHLTYHPSRDHIRVLGPRVFPAYAHEDIPAIKLGEVVRDLA